MVQSLWFRDFSIQPKENDAYQYKEKLKPVFKSTTSRFMTTLFRVDEMLLEQASVHVSEQVTEQDVEQVIKQVPEQVLKMIQIIKIEQLLAKEIMQKMG